MSVRMFVVGLFVGVAALVLLVATLIAIEYTGFAYWVPASVAMALSVALAAIAGFICGTTYE